MGAIRLIARAFAQAARRHPVRALAAAAGVVLGTALTVLVVALDDAISAPAGPAPAAALAHADLAVRARGADGLGDALVARVRHATSREAYVTPVVEVSSRLVTDDGRTATDGTVSLLGVDRTARAFVRDAALRRLARRPTPADAPRLVAGRAWLERNGLRVGDRALLATPRGPAPWTIVGALPGDLPYGGAVAVGERAAVALAFDHMGRADALYVRLRGGASATPVARTLRRAVGAAGLVGLPATGLARDVGSAALVGALLSATAGLALAGVAAIVLTSWRLLLEDERASIARLRLAGAMPLQLAAGTGPVLLCATLACWLLGVPLGLLAAHLLKGVTSQLAGFDGTAAAVPSAIGLLRPAAAALAGVTAIAAAAWLAATLAFVRAVPVEAIRPADRVVPSRRSSTRALAAALATLGVATAIASPSSPAPALLPPAIVALGGTLAALAVPPLMAHAWSRRGEGFAALAAGRELRAASWRTAAIVLLTASAVASALTLFCVGASHRAAVDRTVRSWTRADLFVSLDPRAAGSGVPRLAPGDEAALERLPDVAQAAAIGIATLERRGREAMLYGWDVPRIAGMVAPSVRAGARGRALRQALAAGAVAVSSGMAQLDGLHPGGHVDLSTATGRWRPRIAAIVDDEVSGGGSVTASLPTFARLTGERGRDIILLSLVPGASPSAVARRARAALPGRPPLSVLDRRAFRDAVAARVANVVRLIDSLALAALALMLLAAALTLSAGFGARRRQMAVAELCGASEQEIGRQLRFEAGTIGAAGWLVGVVAAAPLTTAVLHATARQTGLHPPLVVPLPVLVSSLPLTIGSALLAALVVRPRRLGRSLVERLRYE